MSPDNEFQRSTRLHIAKRLSRTYYRVLCEENQVPHYLQLGYHRTSAVEQGPMGVELIEMRMEQTDEQSDPS